MISKKNSSKFSKTLSALLGSGNISTALVIFVIISLAFNFMRLHDFSGMQLFGKIRSPILSSVICIFLSLNLLTNTWTFQIKLLWFFMVFEALRTLFGFFVIQDYVLNDAWQFFTLRDMFLYLLGIIIPIAYGFSYGKNLRKLLSYFVVAGFMLSVWAVTHSGTGPGGHLGDENDLCSVLIFLMPLCFFNTIYKKSSFAKIFSLVSGLFCLVGIAVTKSRGGFIGLVAVVLFQFLLSRSKAKWLISVTVIALLSFPFIPKEYYNEINSIETEYSSGKGTIDERFRTWEMVIRMWKDPKNTPFGVGLGNSKWNYTNYQEAGSGVFIKSLVGREAHSAYFQILGDMGIWGIVFFFLILNSTRKQLKIVAKGTKSLTEDILKLKIDNDKTDYQSIKNNFTYLEKELTFLGSLSLTMISCWYGVLGAAIGISIAFYPTLWVMLGFSLAIYLYWLKLESAYKAALLEHEIG